METQAQIKAWIRRGKKRTKLMKKREKLLKKQRKKAKNKKNKRYKGGYLSW